MTVTLQIKIHTNDPNLQIQNGDGFHVVISTNYGQKWEKDVNGLATWQTVWQGDPAPATDFFIHVYKTISQGIIEGYSSMFYGFSITGATLQCDIEVALNKNATQPSQTPAEQNQSIGTQWTDIWNNIWKGWEQNNPFSWLTTLLIVIVIAVIVIIAIYIYLQYFKKSRQERLQEKMIMLQAIQSMQAQAGSQQDVLIKLLPLLAGV